MNTSFNLTYAVPAVIPTVFHPATVATPPPSQHRAPFDTTVTDISANHVELPTPPQNNWRVPYQNNPALTRPPSVKKSLPLPLIASSTLLSGCDPTGASVWGLSAGLVAGCITLVSYFSTNNDLTFKQRSYAIAMAGLNTFLLFAITHDAFLIQIVEGSSERGTIWPDNVTPYLFLENKSLYAGAILAVTALNSAPMWSEKLLQAGASLLSWIETTATATGKSVRTGVLATFELLMALPFNARAREERRLKNELKLLEEKFHLEEMRLEFETKKQALLARTEELEEKISETDHKRRAQQAERLAKQLSLPKDF